MLKNPALDELRTKETEAFQRKQSAYKIYEEVRLRTNTAYDEMQAAWRERCAAKKEMNCEYRALKKAKDGRRKAWEEYRRIRDCNSTRISALKDEVYRETREMRSYFNRAGTMYDLGDKTKARAHAEEGHKHKARRDDLKAEIDGLHQEIKAAMQRAERRAPKNDPTAFNQAREAFNEAKARHTLKQARCNNLEIERDRLKAEFNALHVAHLRLKEEMQNLVIETKKMQNT